MPNLLKRKSFALSLTAPPASDALSEALAFTCPWDATSRAEVQVWRGRSFSTARCNPSLLTTR
ncbi:MAG: hypothetical protein JRN16_08065, partial [Nitrososphaerota archaeon]|nr:hypothetical protein [Nitrososphaerota archaeon]